MEKKYIIKLENVEEAYIKTAIAKFCKTKGEVDIDNVSFEIKEELRDDLSIKYHIPDENTLHNININWVE